VIDYVRESTPDGGYNHAHSIVRDPSNDYEDLPIGCKGTIGRRISERSLAVT
jgi:hypothetical protein